MSVKQANLTHAQFLGDLAIPSSLNSSSPVTPVGATRILLVICIRIRGPAGIELWERAVS